MTIDLKSWIKAHESYLSHPYLDTVGKITIGFGRNLADNGISIQEGDLLFDNDFARCEKELSPFSWYKNQPQNIQYALMDMCFNMGILHLLGFKKMLDAIESKNYTLAAIEALDSKWAKQVGKRATDVALMIRGGFEDQ
jgi:lysozyme